MLKKNKKHLPELKELFIPCPICGGTTDFDFYGRVICLSCDAVWDHTGRPLVLAEVAYNG